MNKALIKLAFHLGYKAAQNEQPDYSDPEAMYSLIRDKGLGAIDIDKAIIGYLDKTNQPKGSAGVGIIERPSNKQYHYDQRIGQPEYVLSRRRKIPSANVAGERSPKPAWGSLTYPSLLPGVDERRAPFWKYPFKFDIIRRGQKLMEEAIPTGDFTGHRLVSQDQLDSARKIQADAISRNYGYEYGSEEQQKLFDRFLHAGKENQYRWMLGNGDSEIENSTERKPFPEVDRLIPDYLRPQYEQDIDSMVQATPRRSQTAFA